MTLKEMGGVAPLPGPGGGVADLTPKEIVAELDKYIVGQSDAKRSVAIALRNRYRRRRLDGAIRDEVVPKNILMMGPTGVGKTEIARRLAKLVQAPFVKVEATKFTEVGYVGRDVEAMVRDLVDTAIRMVKEEQMVHVDRRAREMADDRIIEALAPLPKRRRPASNPFEALFGQPQARQEPEADDGFPEKMAEAKARRQEMARRLAQGELEDHIISVELEDSRRQMLDIFPGAGMEEMSINLQDMFGGLLPRRTRTRRLPVKEARELLRQEEAAKLIDMEQVTAEAVRRAEQSGIIFIDEIDKIAGGGGGRGPDVSREGVQRDILPIVEGSTVMTKHGPVRTDHILFIAAGAFHMSKPSDLVPELQGRFPLRVELKSLGEEDFVRILVEPENSLIKQYKALLATDGVELQFTDDGIREMARLARQVNEQTENIGARRLHTMMEKVLEEVSFRAPEAGLGPVIVDEEYVSVRLAPAVADSDVTRFIL